MFIYMLRGLIRELQIIVIIKNEQIHHLFHASISMSPKPMKYSIKKILILSFFFINNN